MMYKRILISIVAVFMGILSVNAQNEIKDSKAVQVSFGFPIGSNGLMSPYTTNNVSFNMLWGVNGGLNGVEVGGLANYNTDDVLGIQVAGIANATKGNSTGIITSGISNYTHKNSLGLQVAGIANTTLGNSDGIMVAGIANTTIGASRGIQVAGISNSTIDSSMGVYVSGISNFSGGDMIGTQVSTVNVALGDYTGLQLSTVNLAGKKMIGSQIGVVNVANEFKGFQLGVVNVINKSDGAIPIGVVSFVHNGYFAFELSASEVHFANLSYKMGVEKFYNIYNLAYQNNIGDNSIAFGYGFGTMHSVAKRSKVSVEALCSQSFYNDDDIAINMLNTLRVKYNVELTKHISINAGPSYNVYVTGSKMDASQDLINHPKALVSHQGRYADVAQWFGFSTGVAFRF